MALLSDGGDQANNVLAIKENKELQIQNHELRKQLEFESNQNISLRSQLNQLNN